MIREIEAKVMLAHVKQPDAWFGLKYNMNTQSHTNYSSFILHASDRNARPVFPAGGFG